MPINQLSDEAYLVLIRKALQVCRNYKPKLGRGKKAGYSLDEFRELYQQDPFYSWFGLDSPLVYTAHKAAGGITSVYRQIGIACQGLFHQILQDTLGLTATQSTWSYTVPSTTGKERTLSLDGRIPVADITTTTRLSTVRQWLKEASTFVKLDPGAFERLHGAVFEVRQGYKSKDSKRQNADIANSANAYAHFYLPVILLLSTQIDSDIAERYVRSR